MARGRWIHVKLRNRWVEVDRPLHLLARFVPGLATRRPTSLTGLRELCAKIADDPSIEGVIWEIPTLHGGWGSVSAVRQLMMKLRDAGKNVVAWLPEGGGNRELYLASAASRILTSPQATLAPLGVAATSNYLKGLFDRVGVTIEVHRRAEFKTAAEPAIRDSMSEAQREQIGALLDAVDEALVSALVSRPHMSETKVRELFETAIISGQAALDAGLVDGLCYEDGLPAALTHDGAIPDIVRASKYFRFHRSRFFRPVGPRPFIAIVPIHGVITSGGGGLSAGGPPASQDAVIAAIRSVGRDPRAVGVVLHIESPGGSALASDLIHREVELLSEKKPVVACFGEVAASGGYYIGAAADAIVAEPLAVTGSIGVVSARLVAREFLENVGIRTEVIRRAPHADLHTNLRPMDEGEHAIIEREIDGFYRAFVRVVAKGRKRTEEEIELLARGRVWSGRDAKARGLVDELGGLDVAIEQVRSRVTAIPARLVAWAEPRVLWPREEDAPPIPFAAASMREVAIAFGRIGGVVSQVDRDVADLLALFQSRDRVLFYAMGLPCFE